MTLPKKYQEWRNRAKKPARDPAFLVIARQSEQIITLCDALEKAILTLNFYAHHYKNMSLDKVTFKNAHGDTPDIAGMARETLKEICGEEK